MAGDTGCSDGLTRLGLAFGYTPMCGRVPCCRPVERPFTSGLSVSDFASAERERIRLGRFVNYDAILGDLAFRRAATSSTHSGVNRNTGASASGSSKATFRTIRRPFSAPSRHRRITSGGMERVTTASGWARLRASRSSPTRRLRGLGTFTTPQECPVHNDPSCATRSLLRAGAGGARFGSALSARLTSWGRGEPLL